jgi:hypothetical protein
LVLLFLYENAGVGPFESTAGTSGTGNVPGNEEERQVPCGACGRC